MQYHPQIIYTRLNDVFESNNNFSEKTNNQNLSNNNYPNLFIQHKAKKKEPKPKYVNKGLIKSWINALQFSKSI